MKEAPTRKKSHTDWERLEALQDEDIDTSDIPALDEDFFRHAQIRLPQSKVPVTIRLDADVLQWFKAAGHGYQTRINAVLRTYVEAVKTQQSR